MRPFPPALPMPTQTLALTMALTLTLAAPLHAEGAGAVPPGSADAADEDPGAAPPEVGAGALIGDLDVSTCLERPWSDAFGDCLASLGASEEAVVLADRLAADPLIGTAGVLTGFRELGAVDLAQIDFPLLANANAQPLLVNGSDPLIAPGFLPAYHDAPPPGDRTSRALAAAAPDAMRAGPPQFAGYRVLPDGGQRFVFADRITDGCRACAVIGTALWQVDFRDGVQVASGQVAWAPPAAALEGEAARAALEAGAVAVLQYRLDLAGHDAGGIDGHAGARTRAGLAAFLAGNCLPPDEDPARLSPGAARVLAGLADGACPAPSDG
ncbi:MAG: hypothetical protein IT542_05685 [Rubellimicrobium sp.]|nr:hypothetical protein [Rubellimicrobium sp.]